MTHSRHPSPFPLLATVCVLAALLLAPALAGGSPSATQAPAAGPGEPPEGLSAEAWQAISGAIERDRYAARPAAAAGELEAANPAQGYAARFTTGGVTVSSGDGAAELALTLVGAGFGEALLPVAPAEPRAHGQRVEYVRGEITEWYVNRPAGLEQGWTLAAPPGENPGAEPLRLALAVGGGLEPHLAAGGAAVELRDAAGKTRLRYAGLRAWDATGRELPARLEAAAGRIAIAVEEAGAVYPVNVDPTIVNESAKLLPSDGAAEDQFGLAVSVSGSTVVVGAWLDGDNGYRSGGAYVFEEPVGGWSGTLNESAKLLPSDGAANDYFGFSVSVLGSTVVVGANGDDHEVDCYEDYICDFVCDEDYLFCDEVCYWGEVCTRIAQAGSAYVFEEPAGGWSGTVNESAKLLASDPEYLDEFGSGVSVSGSTVFVGAYGDDVYGFRSGSAYVFEEPAGGWSGTLNEIGKLVPSDGGLGDQFARFTVSASGSTVAVGAMTDDDNGSNSGSAYVFEEPAGGWSGTVNETAKLLPSDPGWNDQFGIWVSISGSTVVVGAIQDSDNGLASGSAYVFEEPAGGWSGTVNESAKLLPSDGATYDLFGRSVSISGSTVVVGAYTDDDDGVNSGSAYVFVEPAGGWSGTVSESAKLQPSDLAAGDHFGFTVSVSGSTLVVGAFRDGDNGPVSGSAYVFELLPCNDNDGDGYGSPASPLCTHSAEDCDDGDADVNPGASETVCDGLDNDCDPATADDANADGDPVSVCGGDCDDGDADVYPGNTETTCDGKDNDCNAATLDDPNPDGDPVSFCDVPTDCDNNDPRNYPGNLEFCDGADNNCDAAVDEGFDLDGNGVADCGDLHIFQDAGATDALGNPYVLLEAEGWSVPLVPSTTGDACRWEGLDDSANGASGPAPGTNALWPPIGTNRYGCNRNGGAKALYKIVFTKPGTYTLYLRNRSGEHWRWEVWSSDVFDQFARSKARGNPHGTYAWTKTLRTFTVTAAQVGKPRLLVLSPRDEAFVLDQMLLTTSSALTDFSGLAASPTTVVNPLGGAGYTGFEETVAGTDAFAPGAGHGEIGFATTAGPGQAKVLGGAELGPVAAPSQRGLLPTSGRQFLALWGGGGPVTVAFDPVAVGGLTQPRLSMSLLIPAGSYGFTSADPGLTVQVVTDAGTLSLPLHGELLRQASGNLLDLTLPVPAGATTATLSLSLAVAPANAETKQVWVDNVVFREP